MWVCGERTINSYFFVSAFVDKVSLCSPGCPETPSVDQASLELTEICLSLSPRPGIKHGAKTEVLF